MAQPLSSASADLRSLGYGRIARLYRLLEYVAFGRSLIAARAAFLEYLGDAQLVGVFGAGDGRCFDALLKAAPHARFVSIDSDPIMTSLARGRVECLAGTGRVDFICDDARKVRRAPGSYDAVVTQFFLDCFPADELDRVITTIGESLSPRGPWLFADFALPQQPGVARLRAMLWIRVLCTFFRWQTGHPLRSLPPMEALLERSGFHCEAERPRNAGLIRSAVYRRKG